VQRGSDRIGPARDDERKHELQGLLRSGHSTRAEEWHDPEPAADDDPVVAGGPVAQGAPDSVALRFELARHLTREPFPAKRGALLRAMHDHHAPDPLIGMVEELPEDGAHYRNVQDVVRALGLEPHET
jgi:hypothetical protein